MRSWIVALVLSLSVVAHAEEGVPNGRVDFGLVGSTSSSELPASGPPYASQSFSPAFRAAGSALGAFTGSPVQDWFSLAFGAGPMWGDEITDPDAKSYESNLNFWYRIGIGARLVLGPAFLRGGYEGGMDPSRNRVGTWSSVFLHTWGGAAGVHVDPFELEAGYGLGGSGFGDFNHVHVEAAFKPFSSGVIQWFVARVDAMPGEQLNQYLVWLMARIQP